MKRINGWTVPGLILTLILIALVVAALVNIFYLNPGIFTNPFTQSAQQLKQTADTVQLTLDSIGLLFGYSVIVGFFGIFFNIIGIINSQYKKWPIINLCLCITLPIIFFIIDLLLFFGGFIQSIPFTLG